MASDSAMRAIIVDALDELNEEEKIADVWREDADEPSYPPTAVYERSRRIQWRLRLRRVFTLLFMLLVAVIGGLGTADWSIPGFLYAFLFGGGAAFVAASVFTRPWADNQIRALQLYDLLTQIDDDSAPSSSTADRE